MTTNNSNVATLTPETIKANQLAAQEALMKINFIQVELTETQVKAMKELGITDDRHAIAEAAFASVLRGKVESAINKAIKAKYLADSRGKKAVSDELEKEIQASIKLKREL